MFLSNRKMINQIFIGIFNGARAFVEVYGNVLGISRTGIKAGGHLLVVEILRRCRQDQRNEGRRSRSYQSCGLLAAGRLLKPQSDALKAYRRRRWSIWDQATLCRWESPPFRPYSHIWSAKVRLWSQVKTPAKAILYLRYRSLPI